ncbi:double-cubane-cluster-containing anaerobic reductase [Desulfogranum japonicum]|uniref:double-cubane-cluster-containing anaerobic reductase n=1 Tax=Desulfogranum japonicum TaxID=231447 RepID=UPI00040510E1|nr:double-cubane-cluster-containing anaerobic reductase [Desulfogranum japonicum]
MKEEIANRLQQISEQNLIDIEQAKEQGRSVIGFYCLYSPTEMAVAVNAIPVPLCGTRNDPIPAAEETLPRNLCPLIKSSYGYGVSDTCPYFRASDIIIGDTTCDGKKKMFELMARFKPTHVIELPQSQNNPMAMEFWRAEIEHFKTVIEETSGQQIDKAKLGAAIKLMNRERHVRKALMDVNKAKPAPLRGAELIEILFRVGFLADKEYGISLMEELTAAAREGAFRQGDPPKNRARRILLTGVPVGLGSDKIVNIVEQLGSDIVAFENCSGYKQAFTVDEGKDPIDALAEQYLATPCSVMSPNEGRFNLLREMVEEFSIDGVIDLTWQGCHTYNVEAYLVDKMLQETFGITSLHLETDYSESDTEQLKVRIEAYLEML